MRLQRKTKAFTVTLVLFIVLPAIYIATLDQTLPRAKGPDDFYLGVTYSGNSVSEAKQLIDKVKSYTNLIVIQSGSLGLEKINEICDYSVKSNMNFLVYFGSQHFAQRNNWLSTLNPAWKEHFLGVYFGDEMGGKMLDTDVWFTTPGYSLINAYKYRNGTVSAVLPSVDSNVLFQNDGSLVLWEFLGLPDGGIQYTTYYPNGSVIREIQPYNQQRYQIDSVGVKPLSVPEIWKQRPFQTYDEAAKIFVASYNHSLHAVGFVRPNSQPIELQNYTSCTADYALYWYDYLSGCDVVFAEIGWNQTLAQDLALVRGAATLQNKSWGAMITWKYMQPPYLDSGDAIYNQMQSSYEAGAKYIVVFNYAENMTGPFGILNDEHFDALKRFWNDVVQDQGAKQGSNRAEAVLVLPHNYGWGMRHQQDNIWGLWQPDEKSPQIWSTLQRLLTRYDTKLDIVYEDEAFSIAAKYSQVYYWNQTS